jgi:hypothetical protein
VKRTAWIWQMIKGDLKSLALENRNPTSTDKKKIVCHPQGTR